MANLTQPLETRMVRSASSDSLTQSSSFTTSSTSQCSPSSSSSWPAPALPSPSPPLTNPFSPSSSAPQAERHAAVVSQLINTAKAQCSDLDFCKSLGSNMRGILSKVNLLACFFFVSRVLQLVFFFFSSKKKCDTPLKDNVRGSLKN